ncbi:hypothetical protein PVL29_012520 [Vitis rotundifolia]|uniref:Uncharacterized protein n=1 Tax=Vitis rotundifolia TaxID=103349 RepID=A0AA38ZJR7_VITRO|nr:hypothetical protein PVL29_012520 [Vitis rotundifolia]
MEGKFNNFVMVWVSAFVSLSYCYTMAKIIPNGTTRLLTIIPVVALFLFLPLRLHTLHLSGTSAFFIAWLANFKLLLFAFRQRPFIIRPMNLLPPFRSPSLENPSTEKPKKGQKSPLVYAVKGAVLALVIVAVHFRENMHPIVSLFLLLFQMYLSLEFILALVASLQPSLEFFWAWSSLHSSTNPTSPPPSKTSGEDDGTSWLPVSCAPVYEPTMLLKQVLAGAPALPAFVSGPLAVAFVVATGFWLFFPQLFRLNADVRGVEEYAAFVTFLNNIGRALTFNLIRC